MTHHLLIIDDESDIRELSSTFFREQCGYIVDTAASGDEGIDLLQRQDVDVVITDLIMNHGSGEEVAAWVVKHKPYIGVIVMTGFGSIESAVNLMKMGATDYVLKPFIFGELKVVVERCIAAREMAEENRLLREANARMREVKEMKDKFLALTSHELKTPLTIINTILGIFAQRPEIAREDDQYLQLLKRTVTSLARSIGDMQQLALSQDEYFSLHLQATDIAAMVRGVLDDIRLLARNRRLSFTLNGDTEGRYILPLDTEKIRQSIFELLQNAVKFTPDDGHISVGLQRVEMAGERPGDVRIIISDTGIGIPAAEQEKIFEKFYKIQDARHHHSSESAFLGGGMGIGLPLALGMVAAHHGTITVESTPDEGASFTVSLPDTSRGTTATD
ncbi:MAG: response regulator [Deltaproteobacteria bacterium]|nr:response regulator [Candidatus Anaeroferrophillacea bacterium]